MILYLTYNDQPSGVYWSQVTDVVDHLNGLDNVRVRLVAFVSIRGFGSTRRAIKQRSPKAVVVPMVPQMRRWKWNTFLLGVVCLLLRPSGVVARGVFATWMALRVRDLGLVERVCFDGRGAYAAEWEEYRLIDDDALIAQFRPLEQRSVCDADFRLAVSASLVQHWRERYGYVGEEHIVVPCTLGTHMGEQEDPVFASDRAGTPYGPTDIVLVYSGSTAGWQSFELLSSFLTELLGPKPEMKVLFLSKPDPNNAILKERFPGQVSVKWLAPEDVARWLRACDHGIMLREETLTNRVASPTKFAEYLSAGLPVVISPNLGDFSGLVEQEHLGSVYRPGTGTLRLGRTNDSERQRLSRFAIRYFTKEAFDPAYMRLLEALVPGRVQR